MHPLVRDLYKRVLLVGRDYPTGLNHVKVKWKEAIRDPRNCPSCYSTVDSKPGNPSLNQSKRIEAVVVDSKECHDEVLHAVYRGRLMVKEMVGIIQLKKYRAMKQRYNVHDDDEEV